MEYLEFSEKLPVRKGVDVLVAGGGVAGIAAALAAQRQGKQALLLEKATFLGGLATLGLINFYVPMCNGRGRQIIFGMADELFRLSTKVGYATIPEEWREGEPKEPTQVRMTNRYSPQIYALLLLELLRDAGVQVLFDCLASKPVMEGGHCRGVVVESKSGREFIPAKVVIDTTGDADLLYRAGVPTVQGKNYFTYIAHAITLDSCRRAVETGDIGKAIAGRSGGGASLYGKGHPEGMRFYRGTDVDDVNEYLQANQMLMLSKLKREDSRSRDVVTLPGMCQFRTTRRLDGDFTLSEMDCYRHFDDSIASICDFDRRDFLYEVPYRCITRSGYDNLLTAGRSASASGYGWDVVRVIPPAIVVGQAAGYAASLSLDRGVGVPEIPVRELQSILEDNGAPVHFDDSLVPEKRVVERDPNVEHL